MKEDTTAYKGRIKTFQMTVLVIMVFVMVIGGCVFGLGVKTRPVLRITRPETFHHVKWILDMMIATGLAQLSTAGLDCFATCWKLIWPLYLAIGLTALTVFLELGSIATSLHLLHAADELANEDIVHPWYWVECQVSQSCNSALLSYVYYFVMPQVVLSALAIFLQCMGIFTMGRMVNTVAEYRKTMESYSDWYRGHYNEVQAEPTLLLNTTFTTVTNPTSSIEMTPIHFDENDNRHPFDTASPPILPPPNNTPASDDCEKTIGENRVKKVQFHIASIETQQEQSPSP